MVDVGLGGLAGPLVRLMMFLLKMVDYSMSFFDGQVGWTTLKFSYFLNLLWDTSTKLFVWWVEWLAPNIFYQPLAF